MRVRMGSPGRPPAIHGRKMKGLQETLPQIFPQLRFVQLYDLLFHTRSFLLLASIV